MADGFIRGCTSLPRGVEVEKGEVSGEGRRRGEKRQRDFRQSIVVSRTEFAQNSRGYGRDYVSIIYTPVDLGPRPRAVHLDFRRLFGVRTSRYVHRYIHTYRIVHRSDRSIHDVTP